MKFLSKRVLGFLIFGLVLVYYFGLTLNGRLFFWGVKFTELMVGPVSSQADGLMARTKRAEIVVKRTITDNSQRTINSKVNSLMDLYKPTASPYPEAITNLSGCAEEYFPKERLVKGGRVFTLFANERKSFGVCSTDLIKFRATYGIFDCGNRGVFEVGVFGYNDEAVEVINKFKCS